MQTISFLLYVARFSSMEIFAQYLSTDGSRHWVGIWYEKVIYRFFFLLLVFPHRLISTSFPLSLYCCLYVFHSKLLLDGKRERSWQFRLSWTFFPGQIFCLYALVLSSLFIFVHWKLHIVVYFEKEIPRKCNHHCNALQSNDVQKVVFFEYFDTHRKNIHTHMQAYIG